MKDQGTTCYWPHNYKDSLLKKPPNLQWPKYAIIVRGTYSKFTAYFYLSLSIVLYYLKAFTVVLIFKTNLNLILDDYKKARSKLLEESSDDLSADIRKQRNAGKPTRYQTTESETESRQKKRGGNNVDICLA